jgi:7,8-dihydroneopterin aldolase/epimerase/oxygenase
MTIKRKVSLQSIRIYAYHGFYEVERRIGADYTLDVKLEWTAEKRIVENLSETANYEVLFEIARREMGIPTPLLETVAGRIADAIQESFPRAERIVVRIHKPVQLGGAVERATVTEIRNI